MFLNPYLNQPHFYKGQVHCHSTRSDGNQSPWVVLREYDDRGYDFVCLTDHDRIGSGTFDCWWGDDCKWLPCDTVFSDPDDFLRALASRYPGPPPESLKPSNVLFIPSEESGKGHSTHFLRLGLTDQDHCRPSGGFDLRAWLEDAQRQGAVAVAPHPRKDGHHWTDAELRLPWLHGLEVKNSSEGVELWDSLLKADRHRWAFCADDSHGPSTINRRGWVVVNSDNPKPTRREIIESMRVGSFYSVLPDPNHAEPTRSPAFERIHTSVASVHVQFRGASTVRFLGRDGLLAVLDGLPDSGTGTQQAHSYTSKGDEGYIRIELEDSEGTIAFSQPLFVYGRSQTDCIAIDSTRAYVAQHQGQWKVLSVGYPLLAFGSDERAARRALEIMRHYGFTSMCFVGRPQPSMQYFLVNGEAPTGAMPGEASVPFNRSSLAAQLVVVASGSVHRQSWKVVEGDHWVLDCGDSEIQARRSIEMINRYQFEYLCKGPGDMVYFRR